MTELLIGTAGWSISRDCADAFAGDGSALERYASVFGCTEINSSFYRSHKKETYARWVASVPRDFRFSVKLPKAISHKARLVEADGLLAQFIDEISMLGGKLGAVLVQLPPSLAFDAAVAERFFALCRASYGGVWVCEPRHESWFRAEADAVLAAHEIGRVGADPAKIAGSETPVMRNGVGYWRLHGSPLVYYSGYSQDYLQGLARRLGESGARQSWCIFDNTASGEALRNALALVRMEQGVV